MSISVEWRPTAGPSASDLVRGTQGRVPRCECHLPVIGDVAIGQAPLSLAVGWRKDPVDRHEESSRRPRLALLRRSAAPDAICGWRPDWSAPWSWPPKCSSSGSTVEDDAHTAANGGRDLRITAKDAKERCPAKSGSIFDDDGRTPERLSFAVAGVRGRDPCSTVGRPTPSRRTRYSSRPAGIPQHEVEQSDLHRMLAAMAQLRRRTARWRPALGRDARKPCDRSRHPRSGRPRPALPSQGKRFSCFPARRSRWAPPTARSCASRWPKADRAGRLSDRRGRHASHRARGSSIAWPRSSAARRRTSRRDSLKNATPWPRRPASHSATPAMPISFPSGSIAAAWRCGARPPSAAACYTPGCSTT